MKTHVTDATVCPNCGDRHDRASNLINVGRPIPGDFCLCINCGAICQYDKNIHLVTANKYDLLELCQQDGDAFNKMMSARESIRNRKPNK